MVGEIETIQFNLTNFVLMLRVRSQIPQAGVLTIKEKRNNSAINLPQTNVLVGSGYRAEACSAVSPARPDTASLAAV